MGGPREVHPPSRGFHTRLSPLDHPTPILEARTLRLASPSSASQSEAGLESVTLALELSFHEACSSQSTPAERTLSRCMVDSHLRIGKAAGTL